MTTSLVVGSLAEVARRSGRTLAESFLSASTIIVVDVSGSMDTKDARGGQRRYNVACEELRSLQERLPGKVAVVAFSDAPSFIPSGVPPFLGGGTDLAAALRFVQPADGTVDYVVISDGEPNDAEAAIAIAQTLTSRIDVVYVGPKSERRGAEFLQNLARAGGGRYRTAEKAHELAQTVERLMLT